MAESGRLPRLYERLVAGGVRTRSASFVLLKKMKEVKLLLKAWNKDCFGRLKANKKLALSQVEAWDHLEETRDLTLEEIEAKKGGAKDGFKGKNCERKVIGDKSPGKRGLGRETGTHPFSIGWPIPFQEKHPHKNQN